jgi:hypothetical protein
LLAVFSGADARTAGSHPALQLEGFKILSGLTMLMVLL